MAIGSIKEAGLYAPMSPERARHNLLPLNRLIQADIAAELSPKPESPERIDYTFFGIQEAIGEMTGAKIPLGLTQAQEFASYRFQLIFHKDSESVLWVGTQQQASDRIRFDSATITIEIERDYEEGSGVRVPKNLRLGLVDKKRPVAFAYSLTQPRFPLQEIDIAVSKEDLFDETALNNLTGRQRAIESLPTIYNAYSRTNAAGIITKGMTIGQRGETTYAIALKIRRYQNNGEPSLIFADYGDLAHRGGLFAVLTNLQAVVGGQAMSQPVEGERNRAKELPAWHLALPIRLTTAYTPSWE